MNTERMLDMLVNECYNDDQKEKVNKLKFMAKEIKIDRFLFTYSILAIGIEDNLIYGDSEVIKSFYEIDDLSVLNTVDILIAKIIITLSQLTGEDVKKGYENNLSLDKTQPEVKYLINVIREHLSK